MESVALSSGWPVLSGQLLRGDCTVYISGMRSRLENFFWIEIPVDGDVTKWPRLTRLNGTFFRRYWQFGLDIANAKSRPIGVLNARIVVFYRALQVCHHKSKV